MSSIIALFDSHLSHNPFGGKSLRLREIFCRLKNRFDIRYVPIIEENQPIPDYLQKTFSTIRPIVLKKASRPIIRRIKTILCGLPGYYYPLAFPGQWRGIQNQIIAICEQWRVSHVHLFDFYIASFFEGMEKRYKIIWDIADSYWLIYKRRHPLARYDIHTLRVKNYEQKFIAKFFRTVFVGQSDYDLYPVYLRNKLLLFPNGVAEEFMNYQYTPKTLPEPKTLIYTGNMSYPPNIDAVMHFYRKIWPSVLQDDPKVKWYIVGTSPDLIKARLPKDPRIIITGRVDDIKPYLAKAHIYVAPIRLGGGIKNKLLEAMAMQKIIIAYPRATDGFLKDNSIALVKSPHEFSREIRGFFKDKKMLVPEHRSFVKSFYSWEKTANYYENLYRQ